MNFQSYIMPELLIIVPVQYFIGYVIKHTRIISEKCIPLILTGIGITLALTWVLSQPADNALAAAFTAIVQGVLCTATAVYINQVIKQGREK